MLKNLIQRTEAMTGVTGNTYSSAFDMTNIATLSVQAFVDVLANAAGNFDSDDVDTDEDTIVIAATAYQTGLVGQFTTTGVLPTGVTTSTDYFIISDGTTAYKFAASLSDALAGTEIDLTAAGSGDSTFTPTSLAGGTISFQMSNVTVDSEASTTATDWTDIETATAVTADATVWYRKIGPEFRWFRVKGSVTAGSWNGDLRVLGRGTDKN